MRIDILTLFPEMFDAVLKKASSEERLKIKYSICIFTTSGIFLRINTDGLTIIPMAAVSGW